MEEITFKVNGIPQRVITDPKRSLLKVLREDLRLTGTKAGCSAGHCATCAVLVDGDVVLACTYPIAKARDCHVTTIEGIGSITNPHPLQRAFVAAGAVQCGFCTPGMIVRAKALLDKNPSPDRDEIVRAIQPHLCRCTGYASIFRAIEKAAAFMRGETDSLGPKLDERRLIGQPVPRRDALAKATGATLFADDIRVEGCTHMKLVRSPLHHARITSIDTREAASLPGVLAVLTADDVKGTNILKLVGDDQPVLCKDKVRLMGDPVAAVVAATEKIAAEAAEKVRVVYDVLTPVLTAEEALKEGAPRVHDTEPNAYFEKNVITGDVEQAFAEADVLVEGDYSTQTIEHGYLETDSGLAYIHENGQVVVMSGSQNIHQHRQAIADAVGVPLTEVRMIQTTTGGAFGGKLDVAVGGVLAAAALLVKKPVKLVLSRAETFAITSKRHPFFMKGKIGAKKDGTLTALKFDAIADAGAYKTFSMAVMSRGSAHASGPYNFPNCRVIGKTVLTNTAIKGAMRGFGAPQYVFAVESLLDELAKKLNMDPFELRKKNSLMPGHATITGQTLEEDIGFAACLDKIRPLYEHAKKEAGRLSTETHKRGVGLGCVIFGSGISYPDTSEVWAEILEDDRLQVWVGAADVGQGSDTMIWQIAAETMGYPLDRVSFCTTDTGYVPDGNISSGSRQTYVSGRAVQKTVAELKKFMDENRCTSFADLTARGLPTKVKLVHQTGTTRPDPNGHGHLYETYSFGVQMAEVEVEVQTGKVRVVKMTAIHDLGRPINKLNVEGQTEGGIVMGLGYALTEEYLYPATDSFARFRMPRAKDVPEMDVSFVESPRKNGPFGACGAGEFALVPTAPAIANAVCNACGARIHDLPITPEKVKKALAAAR